MSESVDIPKVRIDPIGCYTQAFDLVKGSYWLLLGVSAIAMLVGGAVPIVLIGPMMSGLYLCFLAKYRGDDFDLALLFNGFDFFVPSLIASLIMTGISLVILLPASLVMFAGMFASIAAAEAEGGQAAGPTVALVLFMVVATLILVVGLMAVGLFFAFTFQLIVDRKLTGTAAIAVSARAVARNFAGVLGLMLINLVLSLLGVLACYVGTFFILPISFAAITIAYRKVFPEIPTEPQTIAAA